MLDKVVGERLGVFDILASVASGVLLRERLDGNEHRGYESQERQVVASHGSPSGYCQRPFTGSKGEGTFSACPQAVVRWYLSLVSPKANQKLRGRSGSSYGSVHVAILEVEKLGLTLVRYVSLRKLVVAPVFHLGSDNTGSYVEVVSPLFVDWVVFVGLLKSILGGYAELLANGGKVVLHSNLPLGTVPLNYSTRHISHNHHDEPNNILLAQ